MAYQITKQPLIPALLQAFQAPAFAKNPVIGFRPEVERAPLYSRLFDRLTPQSGNSEYQLDDDQKRRLFRQGLLQFGVAALQPNGGNTGAAIARGLLAGTQGLNEGARQQIEDAYRADKMRLEQLGEIPAGYREFDLTAQAGGLTLEQRKQAARVKLGLDGRASSAGFGFELVEGPDGRKRYSRRNPRTGLVEIYDETTGQFAPLGTASPAMGSPTFEDGSMAPKPMMMGAGGVPIAIDPSMSPQDIAAIQAMEGLAPAPRGFQTGPSPALGVSRRPEDEAAAIEAAKANVGLQYAPAMAAIDVQTAGQKARIGAETDLFYQPQIEGARATAKTQAETQAAAAKRARDSTEALNFLDEAEKLLQRSTGGRVGALGDASARLFNYTTEGAKAASQLDILAAKLVANVPRFEGPQSNIDVQMYMQAAGDLANRDKSTGERLAALQQMRRIANSYANTQPAATAPATSRRLKFNPATGKLE
jgi:hypothetical protein